AVHLHRPEIWRRPRTARGRGRRALRFDRRDRPHDRRSRQHLRYRRGPLRRADLHGGGRGHRGAARPAGATVRALASAVAAMKCRLAGATATLCRLYAAHERAILGSLAVALFLLAWEGLERGWWAQLLQPVIGASAARWQLKPIFISSPTLVAA